MLCACLCRFRYDLLLSLAWRTFLKAYISVHGLNYFHLKNAAKSPEEMESSNPKAGGSDIDNA